MAFLQHTPKILGISLKRSSTFFFLFPAIATIIQGIEMGKFWCAAIFHGTGVFMNHCMCEENTTIYISRVNMLDRENWCEGSKWLNRVFSFWHVVVVGGGGRGSIIFYFWIHAVQQLFFNRISNCSKKIHDHHFRSTQSSFKYAIILKLFINQIKLHPPPHLKMPCVAHIGAHFERTEALQTNSLEKMHARSDDSVSKQTKK